MKFLRPVAILVLGALMTGIVCAAVGATVYPDMRSLQLASIGLLIGTVAGLILFAPLAAGEATRPGFIVRHAGRLDRWSAFLLAMGLGYWLFDSMGEFGGVAALTIIFICAGVRVYLANGIRQTGA